MPTYETIEKPTTSYGEIAKPSFLGYLQQENRFYILLENGFKIIINDQVPTTIAKPTTSYNSIPKPA